jgi:hypothetical protein
MWGLMQWASSPLAYKMLFDDDAHTNAAGLEMVKLQWGHRKLGPNGWIAVPLVCYKPFDSPFGPLTLEPGT